MKLLTDDHSLNAVHFFARQIEKSRGRFLRQFLFIDIFVFGKHTP